MSNFIAQCIFSLFIVIILIVSIYTGRDWPARSTRLLPWIVGFPVLALSVVHFLMLIFRDRGKRIKGETSITEDRKECTEDASPDTIAIKTVQVWGWLLGFAFAIWLLGFLYAVPLFVIFFLKLEAKLGWLASIMFSVITTASVYGLFVGVLDILWPSGIIFKVLG